MLQIFTCKRNQVQIKGPNKEQNKIDSTEYKGMNDHDLHNSMQYIIGTFAAARFNTLHIFAFNFLYLKAFAFKTQMTPQANVQQCVKLVWSNPLGEKNIPNMMTRF